MLNRITGNKNWRAYFRLFAGISLITFSSALPTALSQPAASSAAPARKEVLDPSKFFGLASFGYAAAKNCPEVMEKLFCYCGCDLTDQHVSLLDCFTSIHGVDCHICQEEAILARKMNSDGSPIAEIQKTIDEKYAKDYPFEQDTPAYKNYKATHYGVGATGKDTKDDKTAKPADTKSDTTDKSKTGGKVTKKSDTTSKVKFGDQVAGPEDPDAPPVKPKLKPGKKMPKCCGADEHKETKK
ncbi:MAG: PCYCGC domain-containing protein [Candidatus Obscuribacterales bacterium]|jgi:hypothetical protein|nr:PCYCGC domain-containing protein [Candidatus Obscuribacterales bacterium]